MTFLFLILACHGGRRSDTTTTGPEPDTDDSIGGDTGQDDTGTEDPREDDTATPEQSTVYVAVDGDDGASGAEGEPVASLERAIELASQTGALTISMAAGTYATAVELNDPALAGLVITGAGAGETVLVPSDVASFLPADAPPQLVIRGSDDAGDDPIEVTVRDLSTEGGTRPISIMGGAVVTLERVDVNAPERVGVYVYGPADVTMREVSVLGPLVAADSGDTYDVAYGVSAEGYGWAVASISMEGGGIWDGAVAGFIAANADVNLNGVTIAGILADSATGTFGRGVHVQTQSTLTITGSTFEDNADAGVFSIGSLSVSITGSELSGATGAVLPDSADSSGDGAVVVRGDDAPDYYSYSAIIQDCDFDGNRRAGVIVEDVTYTLSDLRGDEGWYAQGDATDAGSDVTVTIPEDRIILNDTNLNGGGE